MISWKEQRLCFLDKFVYKKLTSGNHYLVGNISLTGYIFPGVIQVLSLETGTAVNFVPLEKDLERIWNGIGIIYYPVSVLCSDKTIEQIRKDVSYLMINQ